MVPNSCTLSWLLIDNSIAIRISRVDSRVLNALFAAVVNMTLGDAGHAATQRDLLAGIEIHPAYRVLRLTRSGYYVLTMSLDDL